MRAPNRAVSPSLVTQSSANREWLRLSHATRDICCAVLPIRPVRQTRSFDSIEPDVLLIEPFLENALAIGFCSARADLRELRPADAVLVRRRP